MGTRLSRKREQEEALRRPGHGICKNTCEALLEIPGRHFDT